MKLNKLVLLFIIQAFIVNDSSASITRTRSMGGIGMITKDNCNYWLFPSALSNQNQLQFELGGTGELLFYDMANYGFDQWAGGIFTLGKTKQKTLGIFFSDASNYQPFRIFNTSSMPANQKLDLFFGKKMTNGSFGMHLSRGSDLKKTSRDTGSDTKTSITQTSIDFGFSKSKSDISFGYQLATFTSNDNETFGHLLDFRYRHFRMFNEALSLIPFFDLEFGFETKENDRGYLWRIWTGAALDYRIDDSNQIIVGFSFLGSSQSSDLGGSTKSSSFTFHVPFIFGGLESAINSWLSIRFGFQKAIKFNILRNEYSYLSAVTNTTTEAPFAMTAGLGVGFKHFTLDFSWSPQILKRGPYFISGSKTELFNFISVNYRL